VYVERLRLEINFINSQVNRICTYLCYRKKPNIQNSNREPFTRDIESIHLASWTKDNSYNSIIVNVKDGVNPSILLVYNVAVRKLMLNY
jgi:hypothetical protein